MRSWSRRQLVGLVSAYRLRLVFHISNWDEGHPEFSENVVPVTWKYLHYVEPSPHAVKQKNGETGSDNGRALNRFHKYSGLKMGGVSPFSEEPAHVLYPHQRRPHAAAT